MMPINYSTKNKAMPLPELSYPSFWLYLEDYKEDLIFRLIYWLSQKPLPRGNDLTLDRVNALFSDLNEELRSYFLNNLPEDTLEELKLLIENALNRLIFAEGSPIIFEGKESFLQKARSLLSAMIDEHVQSKTYSPGEDYEFPQKQ
jgi:hypothetical protein